MTEPTLAARQRTAILLALADIPHPYGLLVSEIAGTTPWAPASLYTPLYELELSGLVEVHRHCRHESEPVARLVEHPDIAALSADREDA